jgi:hypothetical protein
MFAEFTFEVENVTVAFLQIIASLEVKSAISLITFIVWVFVSEHPLD